MVQVKIGGTYVGEGCPPLIIAELSGNHGQCLDKAKTMIRLAAEAGAHAIKLQTYTADSLTIDIDSREFLIDESDSLWRGKTLYSLYQQASTPYAWHAELFSYAHELGLLAFSSPFDEAAVDFLESLSVPCYKIASFENNHLPLIAKVAQTGKPVFMSTGMASLEELEEAVSCARFHGCKDLVLLKCTSHYPASAEGSHLRTLQDMASQFNCVVGLSDHSRGLAVPIAAVALGASVIEKHFVLENDTDAVDADFSLTSGEMKSLVTETRRAWKALGVIKYGGADEEQDSKRYRRSIYVSAPVKAGDYVSEANIKVVRPAFGLHPRHYQMLIGQRFTQDLAKGTALNWSMVNVEYSQGDR